jgi:hypothetical protein
MDAKPDIDGLCFAYELRIQIIEREACPIAFPERCDSA